jgi:hypothetical protein
MKNFFTSVAVLLLLVACTKSNEGPIDEGVTQASLQQIIEDQKIDGVEYCCTDCDCDPKFGEGTDFGFPGDGTIRIEDNYYPIDRIFSTKVEVLTENWEKHRMLLLYFE